MTRIVTWDGDIDRASSGMSVTLTLADEVDVSRGDVLAVGQPEVGHRFQADVVWMDERALDPSRIYLLKHTTRTVSAEVDHPLVLNQIGQVTVRTTRPLIFDRYEENRGTGSFILIDAATNFTAGAGMIVAPLEPQTSVATTPSAAERLARLARGASSDEAAIDAVRKALEDLLT